MKINEYYTGDDKTAQALSDLVYYVGAHAEDGTTPRKDSVTFKNAIQALLNLKEVA